ncbi:MAG: hypothetical protein HN348_15385 [Proteobacteria bacterium]|nr:hypothetical protein [Pseudomonadota bacterium]
MPGAQNAHLEDWHGNWQMMQVFHMGTDESQALAAFEKIKQQINSCDLGTLGSVRSSDDAIGFSLGDSTWDEPHVANEWFRRPNLDLKAHGTAAYFHHEDTRYYELELVLMRLRP